MLTWADAQEILAAGLRMRRAAWHADRYIFRGVRAGYWMRRLDAVVPYEPGTDSAATDWEVVTL